MEFRVFGLDFRMEVVIICVLLGVFIGYSLLCNCSVIINVLFVLYLWQEVLVGINQLMV